MPYTAHWKCSREKNKARGEGCLISLDIALECIPSTAQEHSAFITLYTTSKDFITPCMHVQ